MTAFTLRSSEQQKLQQAKRFVTFQAASNKDGLTLCAKNKYF